MLLNSTERYGSLSIGLHWLMLVLLASIYGCIELRELFEKGSPPREMLKSWHFMLGLSAFTLVWLRLLLRAIAPAPGIRPEPARWQQRIAGAMHLALYLLMIGMPLGGWLLLSAAGKPIPFFGLELPALMDADKALAGTIKDVHETGGKIGYGLIAAHAAAALVHHYLVRDNTLRRILPARR